MNDDDDDDLGRPIFANTREWDSSWVWCVKPVGENGAAPDILVAAKVLLTDLNSLDQAPPDCEAMLDGQLSVIEVTELVNRPTLELSIKAVRQRARREEPQKTEAFFNWDRVLLIEALQKILDAKNAA